MEVVLKHVTAARSAIRRQALDDRRLHVLLARRSDELGDSSRSHHRSANRQTPVAFTPVKSDPLLRLLICDLVGEKVTRESMATLRDEIADIAARLDDTERSARELPHREKYLQIVNHFLRRLLDLHLELVDEVENELA